MYRVLAFFKNGGVGKGMLWHFCVHMPAGSVCEEVGAGRLLRHHRLGQCRGPSLLTQPQLLHSLLFPQAFVSTALYP